MEKRACGLGGRTGGLRRFVALLCALAMVLVLCPVVSAQADEESPGRTAWNNYNYLHNHSQNAMESYSVEVDGVTWYYDLCPNPEGAVVTSASHPSTNNLAIPDHLGGYPVIGIAGDAFVDDSVVESIVIPEGVLFMGGEFSVSLSGTRPFGGNSSLVSVSVPDSLTFTVYDGLDYETAVYCTRESYADEKIGRIHIYPSGNAIQQSRTSVTIDSENTPYTGSAITPKVSVSIGRLQLVEGIDFRCEYFDNVEPGTARVDIFGTGRFAGRITEDFTITESRTSLSTSENEDYYICEADKSYGEYYDYEDDDEGGVYVRADWKYQTDFDYTGAAIQPELTVMGLSGRLVEGVDYTVSYSNNVNAGMGLAVISGIGAYRDSATVAFKIKPLNIASAKVKLAAKRFTWNGNRHRPQVDSVTLGGTALRRGTDYSVTYSAKDDSDVDVYTVTITGKGNYTGEIGTAYIVVPLKTKVTIVEKNKKRCLTLYARSHAETQDDDSLVCSYIQFQISRSKKFTGKSTKKKSVKNYIMPNVTFKKLKRKKTYYVRARTYHQFTNGRIYSAWSAVKKVKTK